MDPTFFVTLVGLNRLLCVLACKGLAGTLFLLASLSNGFMSLLLLYLLLQLHTHFVHNTHDGVGTGFCIVNRFPNSNRTHVVTTHLVSGTPRHNMRIEPTGLHWCEQRVAKRLEGTKLACDV